MDYLGLILLIVFFIIISIAPKLYKDYKFKKKIIGGFNEDMNGYVYIVSNPAFKDNILKIGMTYKKEHIKRMKSLYNTSVPLPFEIEYLIPHKYPKELETFLHNKFKKYRVNKKREFFSLKKDILKKGLQDLDIKKL